MTSSTASRNANSARFSNGNGPTRLRVFSLLTVTRNQRFVRLLIRYTDPVTRLEGYGSGLCACAIKPAIRMCEVAIFNEEVSK